MSMNVGLNSSHNVVYVNRLDNIVKAYHLMTKISTRHLPVLDDNGMVIGMISDRDIARAMKKPLGSDWFAVPANPEFNLTISYKLI
jgi:CBS domain-containing protein